MPASYLTNSFIDYLLHLADNSLILGHRNSEWTGHGPILEQDIALSNISLDLIGQARNFYQYAAGLINGLNGIVSVTEDSLAYLRNPEEFKNLLMLEQENGDWGKTMMRQFLFTSYQHLLYDALSQSKEEQLVAITQKSLKEITYHLRWSSEWVIRLGDGTKESHKRMQQAVDLLWMYTEEMFTPVGYEETILSAEHISLRSLKDKWHTKVAAILTEATLQVPENGVMETGGKEGKHSMLLGNLLSEMQQLQRSFPGCEW